VRICLESHNPKIILILVQSDCRSSRISKSIIQIKYSIRAQQGGEKTNRASTIVQGFQCQICSACVVAKYSAQAGDIVAICRVSETWLDVSCKRLDVSCRTLMFHAQGRLTDVSCKRTSHFGHAPLPHTYIESVCYLEGAAWFSCNAFANEAQQSLHCLCDVEERLAFLALQRCRQVWPGRFPGYVR